MALKPLKEFNAERSAFYFKSKPVPAGNGIACPNCGKELVDSAPNITLTSYPPQKNVACPACGYSGYRIA